MKKLLVVLLLCSCNTNDGGDVMKKHAEMLYPVVSIKAGGVGSGVVIFSGKDITGKDHSIILTAKHVVGLKQNVKVVFYPDKIEHDGKVVKRSKNHDLALIRVEHIHLHVAKFSTPQNPPVFTKVYKVGGGLGLEPFPGEGIVSSLEKYLITVSSSVIFGDSGGALYVKENGGYRLTGILIAIASTKQGPVYHIGIVQNMDSILEFLNAR